MNRDTKVGMVAGSLILGLIKTMDKKQQIKGSTIAYTQYMKRATFNLVATKEERIPLAEITRDSMLMLVKQFKDRNQVMVVATFVESLSMSFEKEMLSFYGSEYLNLMGRFANKQVQDSSFAKESYELSDQLVENIRKLIFDRVEG